MSIGGVINAESRVIPFELCESLQYPSSIACTEGMENHCYSFLLFRRTHKSVITQLISTNPKNESAYFLGRLVVVHSLNSIHVPTHNPVRSLD